MNGVRFWILCIFVFTHLTVSAQEGEPPEQKDDEIQEATFEESADVGKESLEAAYGDARVVVYRDGNESGYSRTFFLRDGAQIDLKKNCGRLNNNISSIEIYAPVGVSVTFYDKRDCYNCKTYSGTFWGYGQGSSSKIHQKTLKYFGIHDSITRMLFRVNGYLPNRQVQYPRC